MTRKIMTVLCLSIMLLLLIIAPVFAGDLRLGLEWQAEEGGEPEAVKLEYLVTDHWGIRGLYAWDDEVLSPGVIYRKNPGRPLTTYFGVGVRDLFDGENRDVSVGKKTELILGLEVKIAKVSAAVEARALPADWFESGADETGYDSEIGLSINIGIRAPRLPWVSDSDRYFLAQLITVEAGDEPYQGQVAVGAVVMNRVASARFPNTIREVATQPNQFHSWPKLQDVEPTESCLRAAKEAMAGVDPAKGALFFYNPETSSAEGIRFFERANLKVTARIGRHVFLK